MADEKVVIKNVKVKYLSTKQDKYDNETSYFKIKDKNIEQKFATLIKVDYKMPWFKSENGQTILKVKSKYVKLKDGELKKEELVVVDITFKYYKFNDVEGFYVCVLG